MGFLAEDLDEGTDFDGAYDTPHRANGRDKMVYWQQCKVSVVKKLESGLWKVIEDIDKPKGKGVLQQGETLLFIGDGGKVKEGK